MNVGIQISHYLTKCEIKENFNKTVKKNFFAHQQFYFKLLELHQSCGM